MAAHASTTRAREHGFTMLETIIACVLLAVALAMASSQLMRSFTATNSTSSLVSGRAQVAELTERLGADVRGARSIGRDGAQLVDPIDMRRAVRTDGALRDLNGVDLDWRDVVVAAPNQLTLQADVLDETGTRSTPECVTWSVATLDDGWVVQRTVRAYTPRCNRAGAVLESDPLTSPTTSAPRPGSRGTPPLFGYVVTERAATSGMRCRSRTISGSSLSSPLRNRVTSVQLDVSSLSTHGDATSRAATRNEFAIRSRGAGDYQYALECAN